MPRTNGPTLRQTIALREYRPGYVTQAKLADEWGISQSSVSRRLSRARTAFGIQQRRRRLGRPLTIPLASLSDLTNV